MHWTAKLACGLTLALATSGCAMKSVRSTPPSCPKAPPIPPSLLSPLNAEQKLSRLLLQSEPPATPETGHGEP